MPNMTTGIMNYRWLCLSLVIFIVDQGTKIWATQTLLLYNPQPVIPFVNLTLAFNAGAAFSFLSDAGGWQRWGFVIVALIITGVLLCWL